MSHWVEAAACKGMDTDVFFLVGAEKRAKKVCEGCPVQPECLTDAMRADTDGVWGGHTQKERRVLRRNELRRRRARGVA